MLYHGCLCICILVSLLGRVSFSSLSRNILTLHTLISFPSFLLIPRKRLVVVRKQTKHLNYFSHQRDNCNITGLADELCHLTKGHYINVSILYQERLGVQPPLPNFVQKGGRTEGQRLIQYLPPQLTTSMLRRRTILNSVHRLVPQ